MKQYKITFIIAITLLSQFGLAQEEEKAKKAACCDISEEIGTHTVHFSMGNMNMVPNVELINQYGENVNLYDLIKGKVVALNFIFTSCKTICPPMGANFVQLKAMMAERLESSELVMLTISIDPTTDTPERLLGWSEKFEAGTGWTLLTGEKNNIDGLLKKLEVYTALKDEHAPIVLLGKEGEQNWVRANGLADPRELANTLNGFFESDTLIGVTEDKTDTFDPDLNYFTNVELINQHGKTMRLYTDLMKDRVVIINPFFSECTGVCPIMSANLEKIQEHLGDKLGKRVHIISITVDYKTDQSEILKVYAESYHAKEGWYFVTGEKENIELALKKLGKSVTSREAHDSIFLIGNVKTKLWKKVNGLADINDIIAQIDSVINDSKD
jgi:cytochrome oxidase Cu insertion factor (SCO1/SenC/PrrC family)